MPSLITWLLVVVAATFAVLALWRLARGRISDRVKIALAIVSVALLLALTVSDWPSNGLTDFWSTHEVFTGMVTTVLLLGVGLLAWDSEAERRQSYLDDSLTAAGLGGFVESIADIDFAMTATLKHPHEVAERAHLGTASSSASAAAGEKPLRWVRSWRQAIELEASPDPRIGPAPLASDLATSAEWQRVADIIVNQSLRRLSGALRDWAPLLTRTRDGSEALVRASRLRQTLMFLDRVESGALAPQDLDSFWEQARGESRVLALAFERASGAPTTRWFLSDTADDLHGDEQATARAAINALPVDGTTTENRRQARAVYLPPRRRRWFGTAG